MAVPDFQNPKIVQDYSTLLQTIRDLFNSQALMHDGTGPLNVATNAIRWSGSGNRFEKFNGTTWNALTATYSINVDSSNKMVTTTDNATNATHYVAFAIGGGTQAQKVSDKLSFNPSNGYLTATGLSATAYGGTSMSLSGGIFSTSQFRSTADFPSFELHRPSQRAYTTCIAGDNLYSIYQTGGGNNIVSGRLFGMDSGGNTYIAGNMNVGGDRLIFAGQSAYYIQFNDSNWGTMYLHMNDGQVGVLNNGGGWATRTYNDGTFRAENNIVAYSDERVKTNWREMDDNFLSNLAKVKNGVYDRTDIVMTQVGVSAQSLQKVMPEAVQEGPDGTLAVAYGNAALVAAIRLAAVVEAQQKQIDKLSAYIERMVGDAK